MAFDTTAKIIITGDAQGLEAAMNRAQQVVSQRSKDIERVLLSAKTALGALGVGLSVTAVASFANQIIKGAESLEDMAQAAGTSVQAMSKFADIARIGGGNAETAAGAIASLNRALMNPNADENKGVGAALKSIGIEADKLLKMSVDKRVEEVALALNKFADDAGKANFATVVFKRSAAEVIPFMNDLAENIQRTGSVTGEQAAQARMAAEEWRRFTIELENFARALMLNVLPAFTRTMQAFRESGLTGAIGSLTNEVLSLKEIEEGWKKAYDAAAKYGSREATPWLIQKNYEHWQSAVNIARARAFQENFVGPPEELRGKPKIQFNPLQNTNTNTKSIDQEALAWERFQDAVEKLTFQNLEKDLKALNDLMEEQDKILRAYFGPLEDQLKALQTENDFYGLLQSEIQDVITARLEEARAIAEFNGADQHKLDFLQREIDLRKQLKEELLIKEQREADQASAKAAKAASDEWKKTSDDIANSLTDALMRGFEDGKDWAKNFVETLKNLFASLVLRPIIQPIAQSASGALLGAIGLGGSSSAGASTGTSLNALTAGSQLLGIGGGTAGLISSIAGSSLFGGTSIGAFGAGLASGVSSFGSLTAGAATLSAGSSVGGAVGAGMMIGTVAPYVAAIAAIGSLIYSALRSRGGPKSGGSVSDWAIPERIFTPSDADQSIQQMLSGIKTQYADIVKQFGASSINPQFALGYDTDPRGTAQNRINSAAMLNGQMFALWDRTYGRGEGALQSGLQDQLTRLLVASLRETDISPAINQMLDALDPATASMQDMSSALEKLNAVSAVSARLHEEYASAMEQADEQYKRRVESLTEQFVKEWTAIADALKEFRTGLLLGDLSTGSPEERLRVAGQQFNSVSSRALLGDVEAMKMMQDASTSYLGTARGYFASSQGYVDVFNQVQSALLSAQEVASRQAQTDVAAQRATQIAAEELKRAQSIALTNLNAGMDRLNAEISIGNKTNEVGLSTLSTQLSSIDRRLANIESNGALARALTSAPAPSPYAAVGI